MEPGNKELVVEYTYKQTISLHVREFIRREIEEGEWKPGIKLPSANKLSSLYGVKRETVIAAMAALEKEGLIRVVSDNEAYVLGERIRRNMEVLEGFTSTMKGAEKSLSFKVISMYKRTAGNKYGHILGVDPEDIIYYIKRLCRANGEPISLEETYIPQYLIPKMEGIDLSVFSIYEIYEMYGITVDEAYETLDLIRLSENDAKLLEISTDSPVMMFRSITRNTEERVIEYNISYTRGDRCSYEVNFTN